MFKWIAPLAIFCAVAGLHGAAGAENRIAPRHEKALSELKIEWDAAVARIAALKTQVDSMPARILALGRLTEAQGYNSSEAKAERTALTALDRDLGLIAGWTRSEKGAQAILEWVAQGPAQAESVDPTTCFGSDGRFATTKACRDYLTINCYMTYAEWGDLKGRVINGNWTVEGRLLAEEVDFLDYVSRREDPRILDSVHFAFCRAAATSGHKFDFGWAWIPNTPSWYYGAFEPFGDAGSFEFSCKDTNYASEAVRLEIAARSVAKGVNKDSLLRWATRARQRAKQCMETVVNRCDNVFFVRDEPILSYVTIGCMRREVSRSDVQRDLTSFDTDAERLQHSTMIDGMNWCSTARAAGFMWRWQKPSLKGCVPGAR